MNFEDNINIDIDCGWDDEKDWMDTRNNYRLFEERDGGTGGQICYDDCPCKNYPKGSLNPCSECKQKIIAKQAWLKKGKK